MPCVYSITTPTAPATYPVKTDNVSMPSWEKKYPPLLRVNIKFMSWINSHSGCPPHPTHPILQMNDGSGFETIVNEPWQTKLRVVRIWWSPPPASPQSAEKFLQAQNFHQSHEQCCCWRGGTCGRDIFICSSFPSLPIQNKLEPVGKMVHDEKRIPWLALCVTTGYMDPCHCGGTAASAWLPSSQQPSQTKPANLLLDF